MNRDNVDSLTWIYRAKTDTLRPKIVGLPVDWKFFTNRTTCNMSKVPGVPILPLNIIKPFWLRAWAASSCAPGVMDPLHESCQRIRGKYPERIPVLLGCRIPGVLEGVHEKKLLLHKEMTLGDLRRKLPNYLGPEIPWEQIQFHIAGCTVVFTDEVLVRVIYDSYADKVH